MSLSVKAFQPMAIASSSSSSSSPSYVYGVGKTSCSLKVLSFPTLQPQSSRIFSVAHKLLFGARPKRSTTSSVRCFSALNPQLKTTLDKVVTSNKVVLFMKGTKEFPQCGFSNTAVQILNSLNVPFETVNILENEILRQGLKEYSNWPTFPQLYIEGEFFGGCDITVEAYQSGQLQEVLQKSMCS
ncbi:Monothiol glutaredoxin-related [Quillaja saponaria]|uniref:Monothiol glutaredoxin-related n=1 Tax=Quillaja saponaria TaxID=32244 RepID=A0AAD7VF65_QUISA|nr:Monothiol glutaredoxin-related [Quillaja saponaria]